MPGSVALAVPLTVLPYGLSESFVETHEWPTVTSQAYADGAVQVRSDGSLPRRSWTLTQRWEFGDIDDLLDFWDDRKGPHEPFYFYPLLADHDPTGASTTGRYRVRFEGSIQREYMMARWPVSLKLVEIT